MYSFWLKLFKRKRRIPQLPQEIIDIIFSYAGIETVIEIRNNYVFKKIYEEKIHTMTWAIKNGHLETIKWLYNHIIIGKGIKNNSFIVRHRIKEIVSMNVSMDLAAKHGHLEVLKWLYTKDIRYTLDTIDIALENGHLEVVKWLVENEYFKSHLNWQDSIRWLVKSLDNADKNDNKKVVKLLLNLGPRFTPKYLVNGIKDDTLKKLNLIYNKYGKEEVKRHHMSDTDNDNFKRL